MTTRSRTSGPGLENSTLSRWSATDLATPGVGEAPLHGFTPGTMLAGRYRIVALLGQGGMGEVYRADDVKLGQAVALKFVRGALSPAALQRLYAEVRIGRQVSHPNVCRLYDVVDVEGRTFLAMEYVDGEDLGSLLARIGRLPPDKVLEIARDLCAGLAAVHDKGVVHRDLKPANVMIDGRGRARITDFGLAFALEAPGADKQAGTPAYMSPEQLAGQELTPRADLYALGLILYEMSCGRRFFEARTVQELLTEHSESKRPKLSSATRLLDPTLERAIVQCLEEEPAARPPSARAVLALLPGGDPLEAAVAAGETPSPDLVAAAGRVGDLSAPAAWAGLVAILGGLLLGGWLVDRASLLRPSSLPRPPELLAERARSILMRFGHDTVGMDSAWSFEWDEAYLAYVDGGESAVDRWASRRGAPELITFFYRQSPAPLVPANRNGVVTRDDPPLALDGMTEVVLDSSGRLVGFVAVPAHVEARPETAPEPDWRVFFEESKLDPAAYTAVPPERAAPVDSDRKAAWEGPHPTLAGRRVRIEAAAYHGRPVWFMVLPPWAAAQPALRPGRPEQIPVPVGQIGLGILALSLPLGGVYLARRNLRLGRGDRQGAFRVALFVFATYSVARILRMDHVSNFAQELALLIQALAYPAFFAGLVWVLYLAVEPYARRRWPHMLISWKRLLAGKLRDPMVGRDLLIGGAVGVALFVLFYASLVAPPLLGRPAPTPQRFVHGPTLAHLSQVGFRIFVNQYSGVLYAMVFLFMLVLLRVILRRQWLAVLAWCALVGNPLIDADPLTEWLFGIARALLLLLVLMRGGLLALAAALVYLFTLIESPLTLHLDAWYAGRQVPVLLVLGGVAAYAFHTALGGKALFGNASLDE